MANILFSSRGWNESRKSYRIYKHFTPVTGHGPEKALISSPDRLPNTKDKYTDKRADPYSTRIADAR